MADIVKGHGRIHRDGMDNLGCSRHQRLLRIEQIAQTPIPSRFQAPQRQLRGHGPKNCAVSCLRIRSLGVGGTCYVPPKWDTPMLQNSRSNTNFHRKRLATDEQSYEEFARYPVRYPSRDRDGDHHRRNRTKRYADILPRPIHHGLLVPDT